MLSNILLLDLQIILLGPVFNLLDCVKISTLRSILYIPIHWATYNVRKNLTLRVI